MKYLIALVLTISLVSVWAIADKPFVDAYAFDSLEHIKIDAYGELDVKPGKENTLKIIASEDIKEHLSISQQDGRLTIVDDRPSSLWHKTAQYWKRLTGKVSADDYVRYELTLATPKSVEINGFFNAKVHNIASDDLSLSFNGVGKLSVAQMNQKTLEVNANGLIDTHFSKIEAQSAAMKINGRGEFQLEKINIARLSLSLNGLLNCRLDGNSKNLDFRMQGDGNCAGANFIAQQADLGLHGNSLLVLEVSKKLKAQTLNGSEIRYYGNPSLELSSAEDHVNITQLAEALPTKMYF